MSEINPNLHSVLHGAVENGASVVPGYFTALEVAMLAGSRQNEVALSRRVPRLGQFIAGLKPHLGEPIIGLSTDTIAGIRPKSSHAFHVDSIARQGISVIIPLTGPEASFYYAPHRQVFPYDMPDSRSLVYGPGDVAILRQSVTVNGDVGYGQTYHLGVAPEKRQLLFFDFITQHVTL